jgi:arylsulfatase A
MTGKYNYRNYDFFGHLNNGEKTFGKLMAENGYTTCIVGKWQLNGLAYPDQIADWNNPQRPVDFGFEEYCLWQLTKKGNQGGRYAKPLLEQNGKVMQLTMDDYGPDIFSNYLLDFITRNKDRPFFAYYPMVLVHDPFSATPGTESWSRTENRMMNDTTYFKDMVAYTDKIIDRIINRLKELDIDNNTLLIFTTDNGTHPTIYTKTNKGIIQGGKGNTTDAGTRVPLLVRWPDKIKGKSSNDAMIGFNDFYPTLAELVGAEDDSDGKSFLPILEGKKYEPRETLFMHYDPRWNKRVSQFRNQFVRTNSYKLYASGEFYNVAKDVLESSPIDTSALNTNEKEKYLLLKAALERHPKFK